MNCPLCGSQVTIQLEIIQGIQLERLYLRLTGVSFGYLLNQDIYKCFVRNVD